MNDMRDDIILGKTSAPMPRGARLITVSARATVSHSSDVGAAGFAYMLVEFPCLITTPGHVSDYMWQPGPTNLVFEQRSIPIACQWTWCQRHEVVVTVGARPFEDAAAFIELSNGPNVSIADDGATDWEFINRMMEREKHSDKIRIQHTRNFLS